MNFEVCIKKRYVNKIGPSLDLAKKELNSANYDFTRAEKSLEEEDYKWAIIMGYYTIFHSAKALLFKYGYKERKHFAVLVFLEDLFKKGKLNHKHVKNFKYALESREDADYNHIYDKETAEEVLLMAEEFIEEMESLVKK